VRVELKQPRRWTEWWSLCALCYASEYRPAAKPDCTGTIPARRIPERALLELYRSYQLDELGVERLAERVYERFGFPTAKACAISITHAWRRNGWPMRNKWESKRLNGKHRHRRLGHRIPEADLRELHLLHTKGKKLSALELARRLYERYGYRKPTSMHRAILDGWKALGLSARGRIEMTVEMSTTNGLSPRDWRERRRRRLAAGLTCKGKQRKPRCAGTTPRGKRCSRPIAANSGYCYSHDPARAAERQAHLAEMWARSPTMNCRLVEWEPVRQELLAAHCEVGAWEPFAEALGLSPRTVLTYASDRNRRVSAEKAAQFRAAIAQVRAPLALGA
jgi:hypothetical protein